MKIYVLTTGDLSRVERIRALLGELKYEFLISPGIMALSDLEETWRAPSQMYRQRAMTAGEIGAFENHLQAWGKISESDEIGLIIEDNADFLITPNTLNKIDFLDQIAKCGLVSFSDFCYQANYSDPFIVSSIKEKRPLPVSCYGITPERAENLVTAAMKTGFILPVDMWLSIPKLCGVYGYVSNLTMAKRKKGLASIANKKRGRKTYNPINMVFRAINKIKYGY